MGGRGGGGGGGRECFVRDEDDMIREFRSIIEDSDEV